MTAPLLGLVMIIRNEAHGILATLDSILPFVDCATILDTGSTDGTQTIVRERLARCGEGFMLHEAPFVNFGATRNRALELHGQASVFTFMPDADDTIINGAQLRSFLNDQIDRDDPAYMITIRRPGSRGDLQYLLPLVLRASARWRYHGRVHEYVGGPAGSNMYARQLIPEAVVQQDMSEQSLANSRARWERDRDLLEQDTMEQPSEPRWWFYLGQTYECLGEHEKAIRAYLTRIALGGMREEVYEAKFRIAKMLQALGKPWADVQQAYLDAHAYDPRHAEPLDAIARYWEGKDNLPLMHLFAAHAAAILQPKDAILFLDRNVYDWRAATMASTSAYYVSKTTGDLTMRARGRTWAEKALRARPDDRQLRFNLSTYAQVASELFPSTKTKTINYTPSQPFVPLNPSIHFSDRWRCVIRTTNYREQNGQYLTPDGSSIQTKNYMAELTDDFEIEQLYEMRDLSGVPRTEFPVHGFEDCRLFSGNDQLFCTATVCDFTDGQRQIALLGLSEGYDIVQAAVLTGPWDRFPQKNWMPIVGKPVLATDFLYRIDPTPIVIPRALAMTDVDYSPGRLRGGSQAVWVDNGWLVIVHAVAFQGAIRNYSHRFVYLDPDFRIVSMTPQFVFERHGIEFCAGLGRRPGSDQLVASFGVGDLTAHLGFFSLYEVFEKLETDYVI